MQGFATKASVALLGLVLTACAAPGGADPEAPRLFSNGRITFTQEIEGGRVVRYAAGRAAFLECKRWP